MCTISFFLAIIPGPEEPHKEQMNHILRPLIDELQLLLQGVEILDKRVRVKIVLWACDLPALRKTLGFLSCNANKGCSKCHQSLRDDDVDPLQKGRPRTDDEHRVTGARLQVMEKSSTKTAKETYEKQTGIR